MQTGSGKTHTMEGSPTDPGVTPRAFEELFRVANESWGNYQYKFNVSLMEIYNEQIKDLLVEKKGTDNVRHEVKTTDDGEVYITDINSKAVTTKERTFVLKSMLEQLKN